MEIRRLIARILPFLGALAFAGGAWADKPLDAKKLLAEPKAYVGS